MLSMIGPVGGLLLTTLALRGWNLFIAAPFCALIVGITGGVPIFHGDEGPAFISTYMDDFASFVAAWLLILLLGKFMEDTGSADSQARWMLQGVRTHF